jgi:hypothetical protein
VLGDLSSSVTFLDVRAAKVAKSHQLVLTYGVNIEERIGARALGIILE